MGRHSACRQPLWLCYTLTIQKQLSSLIFSFIFFPSLSPSLFLSLFGRCVACVLVVCRGVVSGVVDVCLVCGVCGVVLLSRSMLNGFHISLAWSLHQRLP